MISSGAHTAGLDGQVGFFFAGAGAAQQAIAMREAAKFLDDVVTKLRELRDRIEGIAHGFRYAAGQRTEYRDRRLLYFERLSTLQRHKEKQLFQCIELPVVFTGYAPLAVREPEIQYCPCN